MSKQKGFVFPPLSFNLRTLKGHYMNDMFTVVAIYKHNKNILTTGVA